ncbi:hypothetical protein SAICODRAFT_28858 [Saitoella complicata NRRL Y-17804]|uniref:uncharacterized protein n=1 Tax=Saitoella complicata (strain BCRC 22490 / CBS 7301 / JCM 7358 / NBRC 10748 / NRRL Y-17804) TaxID=698492 RepID=UPI0008672A39|nr:uncharacterized protein SAICODRAFT_28858 [Saitoella complicata NRRL Y-17804]ODQ55885.1 hypothetical protein SAICODRAFT_28858 [Saitoella complicata NRRL Y-17804]
MAPSRNVAVSGRAQPGFVKSTINAVFSEENRTFVWAIGVFAAAVGFLQSPMGASILPDV